MAAESDGEEETAGASEAAGRLTGTPQLVVADDLHETAKKASWSGSSCKPGNGVLALRDDNLDTYWQETIINTFMLQIAVLSNHLNGRDTHIRQVKIYGPRLNPVPHQPFHFTSKEFITYSTLRRELSALIM